MQSGIEVPISIIVMHMTLHAYHASVYARFCAERHRDQDLYRFVVDNALQLKWYGQTPNSADVLVFDPDETKMTRDEVFKSFYKYLPPPGTVPDNPVIDYAFMSSTWQFECKCSLCKTWIGKAYTPIYKDKNIPDGDPETYDGGFTSEAALQAAYDKLGAWTTNGLLLCKNCIKNNAEQGSPYEIKRPFKFYGDVPRGRVKYVGGWGDLDMVRDSMYDDHIH